jgi:putative transposase
MSRPLRLEYAGAFYHAYSRGNARQMVFHEPVDFASFLDLLGETCLRFDWHCHAHCLMPNHYHLLIETRSPTLSTGMRHLNGVFTQRYNRRRKRVGHLFQGRYKALLVQDDRYLLELARYIVLNPVRAKLVTYPGDWPWSSHAGLTGTRQAPGWASPASIWKRLAPQPGAAAHAFSEFIGRSHEAPAVGWSADGVLGDEEFKRARRALLEPSRGAVDIPLEMRVIDRPNLPELLGADWPRASTERDKRIVEAVMRWRYGLGEIARHLDIDRATVSRVLKRHRMSQSKT